MQKNSQKNSQKFQLVEQYFKSDLWIEVVHCLKGRQSLSRLFKTLFFR